MKRAGSEAVDFLAHAAMAFLALVAALALGVYFTPEGAVFLAWTPGFVREFTKWQDGERQPFTPWGILNQLGWIAGGLFFVLTANL